MVSINPTWRMAEKMAQTEMQSNEIRQTFRMFKHYLREEKDSLTSKMIVSWAMANRIPIWVIVSEIELGKLDGWFIDKSNGYTQMTKLGIAKLQTLSVQPLSGGLDDVSVHGWPGWG